MEHFRPSPKDSDFGHATDAWHTHRGSESEPTEAHGQLSPRWISVGVLLSMVSFFAICAAVTVLFITVFQREKARKQEIDTGQDAAMTTAQARAELANIGWVDREKGIVRAPIDEAMRLVVRQYEALQSVEGGSAR